MRWRFAVVVAVGCNQFYGLDETNSIDAADADGDTIVDRDDNCPADPNLEQSDIDGDQRGDVCDDCPLLANPADGGDADGDKIADICDAHPSRGDCLVLVDSFTDPAAFVTNWTVVETAGTAMPRAGHVALDATAGRVTIVATGTTGLMDVMVLGEVTMKTASVQAIAGFQPPTPYGCELSAPDGLMANGPGTGTTVLANFVPPNPINARFLIRLVTLDTKDPVDPVVVGCRIDFGVSVGVDVRPMNELLSGGAGVRAGGGTSNIDAVSITRERTALCPPTVYR